MGDTERKQIPLRVSASQKENWEEYQEELGFGSREAMIRRAVEYFYASKTGAAESELTEEISTQMEDIKNTLDILRADVGDVRREQLTTDDVDDIAQEVSYVLEPNWETLVTDDDIVESIEGKFGANDPDEKVVNTAEEFYLTGFARAAKAVQHPDVSEALARMYRDQLELITGDNKAHLDPEDLL